MGIQVEFVEWKKQRQCKQVGKFIEKRGNKQQEILNGSDVADVQRKNVRPTTLHDCLVYIGLSDIFVLRYFLLLSKSDPSKSDPSINPPAASDGSRTLSG